MLTLILECAVLWVGLGALALFVTPDHWIDREPLRWWMRLWGVLLTPVMTLAHPLLVATARNEYERTRQIEGYRDYMRKVWLGE